MNEPIWKPDSTGEYHLGDLMYNLGIGKEEKKMKIDQKYYGMIFKNDGTPVPEEETIVFRAKDRAVPAMLDAYIKECKKIGASDFHIGGMELLKERVLHFQKTVWVGIPTTTPEDLIRN